MKPLLRISPHASIRNFASAARPPPPPPARRTALKVLAGLGVAGTAGYWWDRQYNAQALRRTFRTAVFGVVMAVDFKLNFKPDSPEAIAALHERAAKRIHTLCVTNGGLYIKLAQSLAIQAAVLPPPYRVAFANVFDAAPQISYDEVVDVFVSEFGVHPDQAFEEFSHVASASASIAQVHKARLKRPAGSPAWKEDEGWVAVKIRKPSVPKQIEWDLFSYRVLLHANEWLFDLPVAFVAKYVSDQMRKESDLLNEAENATKTAGFLAKEPKLRNRVAIPRVEWEWTGKSVMTAEYITASKLTDRTAMAEKGLSEKKVMDTATDLFAAMIFKWGWLHCDPHPGNVLVRPHPSDARQPQIVLIDHGLYIPFSEGFRVQYCQLWRALFTADLGKIESIAEQWGIPKEQSDMFASMTLLRPHRVRKQTAPPEAKVEPSAYDAQVGLKARLKSMLQNEQLIPRELIFLTRTLRMMQANNQNLGSPTNRINAMAHYSIEGLKTHSSFATMTPETRKTIGIAGIAREKLQLVVFRIALLVIDFGFLLTRARQWLFAQFGSTSSEGFEDLLQRQVTAMAKSEFGVDLDESAFSG